jgi:hypothetical protein
MRHFGKNCTTSFLFCVYHVRMTEVRSVRFVGNIASIKEMLFGKSSRKARYKKVKFTLG